MPKTKAKKAGTLLKHTQMSWDWKEKPSEEEMQELLQPFGVYVVAHPGCEGSDSYGFIFSNRKLSEEEMEEAGEGP